MKRGFHSERALLWLGLVLVVTQVSGAYSVLTHEQVVDLLWEDRIQPMLKARFPDLTDKKLREAHAYAYGGSLVQDMGYYPFGSRYFPSSGQPVRQQLHADFSGVAGGYSRVLPEPGRAAGDEKEEERLEAGPG